MSRRHGKLAVRALNQYRRRDVIAYLGLRYYLESSAARTDRWATDVAVDIATRQTRPAYLLVKHFKEVEISGAVVQRDIYLPGPNESLAEAALIDACTSAGSDFQPASCVYSYRPATGKDESGIFVHYIQGLKDRHTEITRACKGNPKARVAFFDIKRFYPTISTKLAEHAWTTACDRSALSKKIGELGIHFLSNHKEASGTLDGHLLTGPMFSHLIGNLVLNELDHQLANGPAKYLRYVDDITLIGSAQAIERSQKMVRKCLDQIGLELHAADSVKNQNITASDWLLGEYDFVESHRKTSWMSLIGDLKRMLVLHPNSTKDLSAALREEGFRLPIPDYTAVADEKGYQVQLQKLLSQPWFRKLANPLSIGGVLAQARTLRQDYKADLEMLLKMSERGGYEAKRALPKLRYRLGRLIYLAEPETLRSVSETTRKIQGLAMQSAVGRSVSDGDISSLIAYGTNATQAAAQAMRMSAYDKELIGAPKSIDELNALAIFNFNGLKVAPVQSNFEESPLFGFSSRGVDLAMMRNSDQFIQELACLHGISEYPRHADVLDTAFDAAENISFDAIEQSQHSFSY